MNSIVGSITPFPQALRTGIFKVFGPIDHTTKGVLAVLSLRVTGIVEGFRP